MNAKELEILKKLLKIAESQQKVLVKLAQATDPFSYYAEETPENKFDPARVDPSMNPVDYNKPIAAPAKTPPTWLTDAVQSYTLPADVEMALRNAPTTAGYKGSLYLTFDGNNATVRYNMDKEMDDAQTVTNNVQAALPQYKVRVVGELHPNWKANF